MSRCFCPRFLGVNQRKGGNDGRHCLWVRETRRRESRFPLADESNSETGDTWTDVRDSGSHIRAPGTKSPERAHRLGPDIVVNMDGNEGKDGYSLTKKETSYAEGKQTAMHGTRDGDRDGVRGGFGRETVIDA